MSLVKKTDFDSLKNFYTDSSYLYIVERKEPKESRAFFRKLLKEQFNIHIVVNKKTIKKEIKKSLDKIILKDNLNYNFYDFWLDDVEKIIKVFMGVTKENYVSFCLESSRGCKRYHIDNVPIRLLVTYFGKGTEWLPTNACNYLAYYKGQGNEKIIKNKNEIKNLGTWDIGIFKGQKFKNEKKGVLHRTPEQALSGGTLLMRLDSAQAYE